MLLEDFLHFILVYQVVQTAIFAGSYGSLSAMHIDAVASGCLVVFKFGLAKVKRLTRVYLATNSFVEIVVRNLAIPINVEHVIYLLELIWGPMVKAFQDQ